MSEVLNAKNLFCPMPVIRAQDKIATMKTGELLIVEATDPGVKNDIPAWCRINGHEVIKIEEQKNLVIVTVKVNHD